MTNVLIQDFTERSKEVSKYFIVLKSLEQGTTQLSMRNKNGGVAELRDDGSRHRNILKLEVVN